MEASPVRWFLLTLLSLLLCTNAVVALDVTNDVVRVARSFKDGGHYLLKGSGTPEAIIFQGHTILPAATNGTYCSGFTFAVAMRTASARGLLKDKTVEQMRHFQREWYGNTSKSAEKQAGVALQTLGLGKNVPIDQARPGDFIQFWRTTKSGHSAVFLGWVMEKARVIGFQYRSSQPGTDGIGEKVEYFADVPEKKGTVLRARTYIARLDS